MHPGQFLAQFLTCQKAGLGIEYANCELKRLSAPRKSTRASGPQLAVQFSNRGKPNGGLGRTEYCPAGRRPRKAGFDSAPRWATRPRFALGLFDNNLVVDWSGLDVCKTPL
jgi:hypothetical protein